MPKPFTQQEKKDIKERLIQSGLSYLGRYPIKHVMLDWIVRDVRISKGAFYLFFASKEALFFDCLMRIHNQTNAKILENIAKNKDKDKKQALLDVLLGMLKEVSQAPWLLRLDEEDYRTLVKKVGEDKLNNHFHEDKETGEKLLGLLGVRVKNIELVTASLRAIFLMFTNETEIGKDVLLDVMTLQTKALVDYIFRKELI